MDRPDREKIHKLLRDVMSTVATIEVQGWPVGAVNKAIGEYVDQILALIPDNAGYKSPEEITAKMQSLQDRHELESDVLIEEGQHKLCEVCEHVAIEEAKKQERERIFSGLKEHGHSSRDTWHFEIDMDYWQAQGEK